MKEPLLLAVIGLFLVALVYRLVRGFSSARRWGRNSTPFPPSNDAELSHLIEEARSSGKIREALREIGRRAHALESAARRAAYHSAAGHLSLSELKRPALAAGFYLRALREDPTCVEALDKLQEILIAQRRLRRLEWTYWDILGRLEDSQVGLEIWMKCWSGLASIYSASPRTVCRADAIRKALSAYGPEDEDEIAAAPNATTLSH